MTEIATTRSYEITMRLTQQETETLLAAVVDPWYWEDQENPRHYVGENSQMEELRLLMRKTINDAINNRNPI